MKTKEKIIIEISFNKFVNSNNDNKSKVIKYYHNNSNKDDNNDKTIIRIT